MGEIFRMLNTQNQQMREQANAHNRIKEKPEKFSWSAGSPFHSFWHSSKTGQKSTVGTKKNDTSCSIVQ